MRIIRHWSSLVVLLGLAAGCSNQENTPVGPTVDQFTGRLVQDGKPISLEDDQSADLQLFSDKGKQTQIPVKPDGTFGLKFIVIGKYSANLIRSSKGDSKKGGAAPYSIPGGLEVVAGKTDYTIELGKNYK